MNKYEKLINQAAADVISEYGRHMERKQINDRMKAAFKKLSNEYSMRDVHRDALTAFVCVSNGDVYYSNRSVLTHAERVERGNKKNQYMIKNNLHPKSPVQKDDADELIDFLRSMSPYQGRTVARGKRKVIGA